ncbi:sensor histidine kinase [Zobellia sp.]|nr:sensor histidine kinase [Zobellia sp.]
MPHNNRIQSRLNDQNRLHLNFVYTTVILSIIICPFLIYVLDIKGYIPATFFIYAILNLINIYLFKFHGKLLASSTINSVLSLISAVIITLFSGSINSPFIFVLSIIILGGYLSGAIFGKIYLVLTIAIILGLFVVCEYFTIENEIPIKSKEHFGFVCLIFCSYLLFGVFGKQLIRTHEKMEYSKIGIEKGIAGKEILLRTVHHRVKNNLQTVSSLLSLQSKNTTNHKIKELAISSQYRINSMAMIHEMLYMRENISQIAFKPYLEELTNFLVKSANSKNLNITVNIDMPDINLGLDTTIPLGLLINEAVTNSLKYGFTENSTGRIDIVLKENLADSQSYFLDIIDDGIGFSEDINHKTTNSLGLKLMHNLGRQLRGSVSRIKTNIGTGYHITFTDKDRQLPSINE